MLYTKKAKRLSTRNTSRSQETFGYKLMCMLYTKKAKGLSTRNTSQSQETFGYKLKCTLYIKKAKGLSTRNTSRSQENLRLKIKVHTKQAKGLSTQNMSRSQKTFGQKRKCALDTRMPRFRRSQKWVTAKKPSAKTKYTLPKSSEQHCKGGGDAFAQYCSLPPKDFITSKQ